MSRRGIIQEYFRIQRSRLSVDVSQNAILTQTRAETTS
jgi:hypothetical protein